MSTITYQDTIGNTAVNIFQISPMTLRAINSADTFFIPTDGANWGDVNAFGTGDIDVARLRLIGSYGHAGTHSALFKSVRGVTGQCLNFAREQNAGTVTFMAPMGTERRADDAVTLSADYSATAMIGGIARFLERNEGHSITAVNIATPDEETCDHFIAALQGEEAVMGFEKDIYQLMARATAGQIYSSVDFFLKKTPSIPPELAKKVRAAFDRWEEKLPNRRDKPEVLAWLARRHGVRKMRSMLDFAVRRLEPYEFKPTGYTIRDWIAHVQGSGYLVAKGLAEKEKRDTATLDELLKVGPEEFVRNSGVRDEDRETAIAAMRFVSDVTRQARADLAQVEAMQGGPTRSLNRTLVDIHTFYETTMDRLIHLSCGPFFSPQADTAQADGGDHFDDVLKSIIGMSIVRDRALYLAEARAADSAEYSSPVRASCLARLNAGLTSVLWSTGDLANSVRQKKQEG